MHGSKLTALAKNKFLPETCLFLVRENTFFRLLKKFANEVGGIFFLVFVVTRHVPSFRRYFNFGVQSAGRPTPVQVVLNIANPRHRNLAV